MTLQASPPITLADIKTEFGIAGTVGLTDLYRGGEHIPDTPANVGVPTSGSIDLLDFLGASNQSVALADETIAASVISPNNAVAGYALNSNGSVQQTINNSTSNIGTWLLGGAASGFEVRATAVSGTVTSGTLNTWLSMSSTNSWTRVNSTDGISTAMTVLTVEIRVASTGQVLDSATITLEASVDI